MNKLIEYMENTMNGKYNDDSERMIAKAKRLGQEATEEERKELLEYINNLPDDKLIGLLK